MHISEPSRYQRRAEEKNYSGRELLKIGLQALRFKLAAVSALPQLLCESRAERRLAEDFMLISYRQVATEH
jgi:hypothetical protein